MEKIFFFLFGVVAGVIATKWYLVFYKKRDSNAGGGGNIHEQDKQDGEHQIA